MKFREMWFNACVWAYFRYEYIVDRVMSAIDMTPDGSKKLPNRW